MSSVGLQSLTGCVRMCCEVCVTFPDSFWWSSFTSWKLRETEQRQKCFKNQLLVSVVSASMTFSNIISSSSKDIFFLWKIKLRALLFWAQNSLCGFRNKGLELVYFPFLWVFGFVVVWVSLFVFCVCVCVIRLQCWSLSLLLGIRSCCKMLLWPSAECFYSYVVVSVLGFAFFVSSFVCDLLSLRGWR